MRRGRPPEPPELPEAARPSWPPWYAPAALFGAFGAIVVASFPLLPVILTFGISEAVAGIALLALLLVQDGLLVLAALLLASLKRSPRRWHFGIRATRLWPTVGLTVLAFALMLGFELGYIELFQVDETNVEDLGQGNPVAGFAVALAVIVVAPVAEEIFFRAFFYRALRTRLAVWSAALIDGLVFGALHFQGTDTAIILPVIAVFGVGQCLVYERTGSLFAVIAIHAAFNTVAMLSLVPLPAVLIGSMVVLACLLAPLKAGRWPSPVPA
ncbi:MAG TPA: type II CAAX endopeptidase family protein [Thermoleophilaceae bacterium]|nr:type II CAAX endopeptidase family protein [Thermoleophilaceae bacterium]